MTAPSVLMLLVVLSMLNCGSLVAPSAVSVALSEPGKGISTMSWRWSALSFNKNAAEGALSSATGTIAASAAAVGAGVAGAVSAATDTGEKALDFNIRPPTSGSSDFRELSDVDLVNNGKEAQSTVKESVKASTQSASSSKPSGTPRPSNTTKGNVIASSAGSGGGEARLIDERKSTPPRSSRTDRVVSISYI